MAKAKKGKLTIEDALVPVEEQPYEIPENWCWTKINSVANVYTGNSINERVKAEKYEGQQSGLLFIATKDVDFDNSINYETNVRITDPENFKKAPADTALLCIEGGSAGRKIGFTNQEVCFGNKLCAFASDKIEPKYIYYFLQSNAFIYQFNEKKHGLIGGVSVKDLSEIGIALPPLEEQKRIVEQIENLFTKLDEAREKVQSSIDACEDRKNAIFARAFSGALTEHWRQINDVSKETWKTIISQDACEPITCGKTPTGFITDEGEIPYLKVYNIVDNKIDFVTTPQFIPRDVHEGKLKPSRLKTNDVIMNIVGPPLRKIAIIPEEYDEWNMNQAIVRFRPKSDIMDYRFLYYTLLNPETLEDVIAQTRGVVGQANISVTQSRNLIFKCPTLNEQVEIVKILDELLQKEEEIYNASVCVLEKIDSMKKAILASAFRGKLGTNDSADEGSIELLKILLEGEE